MPTDSARRFASELAVLRDGVVRAIRGDNISDLKIGLDLYRDLVSTVFDQFRRYEELVGPIGPGLFSYYGREMRWLEDDVRTFLINGVRSPGSDAASEVFGFLHRLVTDAFERRELRAFGAFLHQYSFAWFEGGTEHQSATWSRLRATLLNLLESVGDYYVGPALAGHRIDQDETLTFAKRLVAELTQLMKMSVDGGRDDDLQAAARTLHETMGHAISRQSRVDAHNDDAIPVGDELTAFKEASLLSVQAWITFSVHQRRTTPEEASKLREALRRIPLRPGWNGYVTAADHATSDQLRWVQWETSLWEHRRGGALSFESYVTKTYAQNLLAGRAELPSDIDPSQSNELRYPLQNLLTAVDAVAEDPQRWFADDFEQQRVNDVRSTLQNLLDTANRRIDDALIEAPLVAEQVEQFRNALYAAWKDRRYLRRLGVATEWDPKAKGSSEPEGFGINKLEPKDYFVTRPNVHADPESLGREFGDGLGRGEDELIVEAMQLTLPRRSTSLESLPSIVDETVAALHKNKHSPSVLLFDSWELLEAMRPILNRDDVWPASDDDELRLRDTETPVYFRYGGPKNTCIIADLTKAYTFVVRPPEPEAATDRVRDFLLVGVAPIDENRAAELFNANPSLGRGPEVDTPPAEAIRNIRMQVHVRALEWIDVRPGEPAAGVILEVDDAR